MKLLLALFLLCPAFATAQTIEERVDQLERDVKTVTDKANRFDGTVKDQAQIHTVTENCDEIEYNQSVISGDQEVRIGKEIQCKDQDYLLVSTGIDFFGIRRSYLVKKDDVIVH